MSDFERTQKSVLLERLEEEPQRIIFVTGPRQTGKTTLVNQVLAQTQRPNRYRSVDEPVSAMSSALSMDAVSHGTSRNLRVEKDVRWLVDEWEEVRREARDSQAGFVFAIDEIQKIPNWSEAVKGLWDADRREGRNIHVILLGSAPLLMQKGMSESLAGRFETIRLTHWSFPEMSAAFGFDLPQYIYFGGYPGGASLIHDQGPLARVSPGRAHQNQYRARHFGNAAR